MLIKEPLCSWYENQTSKPPLAKSASTTTETNRRVYLKNSRLGLRRFSDRHQLSLDHLSIPENAAPRQLIVYHSNIRHSITSSALASSAFGISSPMACAVFRLMTRPNETGCSIGSSPGLAPFKILST